MNLCNNTLPRTHCSRFLRVAQSALAGLLSVALVVFCVSCTVPSSEKQEDVLTQKVTESGRQQISVLVKYAFSINSFEQTVEEKFPNIDIVQVGNYTGNMGTAEYESRLEHGDIPDIVMTWPYDVGREYWEDELLDLSGMGFSDKYNLSMLGDISENGKLYYLPGPAQVRGIVYNKTMFEERGWQIPTNFDEFLALCSAIEASGIRSLQLGLGDSEVLDTAFTGYSFADCYSKPQDKLWIESYDQGIGSFGDHFEPALETFQTLIDAGILKPQDLDITYADREAMFYGRECAMIEDSAQIARLGHTIKGSTDEYALMPFFNPGDGGGWARLYMVCYIGLSKQLAEPENSQKYDLVMQLMDYISTPEGQEALMADTGAMFSNLVGTGAPNTPEIEEMQDALRHSRYGAFPELQNAQQALRKGLAGMVKGSFSVDDVIRMVDEQNSSPSVTQQALSLGQAAQNFSLTDTANYVTDVMRKTSGSDIALFLDNGKDGRYNGKGISGSFYEGTVTDADIVRILPDLKYGETGTLWKASMKGSDLITTLEHSIAVDSDQDGWFYYFSGLRMTYDPTAAPGERIHKITLDDGSPLDMNHFYTIAVMDKSVPDEFIISREETGMSIESLLIEAVAQESPISPANDGRFIIAKP